MKQLLPCSDIILDSEHRNFHMSKILVLMVCGLATNAMNCPSGSLPIAGNCVVVRYVQGCAKYTVSGLCGTCQYGMTVVGTGEQIKCEQNNTSQSQCCENFNMRGNCAKCSAGLELRDNECIRVANPGCLETLGHQCINCASGYFQFGRRCLKEVPHCSEYGDNGRCSRCTRGYGVLNGLCLQQLVLPDVSHCELIQPYGCAICTEGYFLTSQRLCQKNKAGCLKHYKQQCHYCAPGYTLVEGECLIDGCLEQGAEGCRVCNPAHRQTSSGGCAIDNCLQYNDDDLCVVCSQQYRLRAGQCVTPQETACATNVQTQELINPSQAESFSQITIERCEMYGADGNCSKCYSPSQLIEWKCLIPGCVVYSNHSCQTCRQPFIERQNSCLIEFCGSYDNSMSKCSVCQAGYHLENYQCVSDINFCQEYTAADEANEVCTKCVKGYHPVEGECVEDDENCLEYQGGSCQTCVAGFVHTSRGLCMRQIPNCRNQGVHGCNRCKDGYYVSGDTCLPEEPGCIYVRGNCAYCNPPFEFDPVSRKCLIEGCGAADALGCKKCLLPYELKDSGVCRIPHCVSFSNNTCRRCSPSYHLKDGLSCVVDDVNCYYYNGDGNCEECASGYIATSSGECSLSKQKCLQTKDGKCFVCSPDYFLNRFYQCELMDKYCESYINGVCAHCLPNYFLYNFICFPYSPGCAEYEGKDCVRCKSSYQLVRGECFKLQKASLKMEGQNQQHNLEISPIDIRESKYYIDNLSPVSKLGTIFYSSFYSKKYTWAAVGSDEKLVPYSNGWRAGNSKPGEYIGFLIEQGDPVTFYALQLEAVGGNYIQEFYLEYSIDGYNYIRIENSFNGTESGTNLTTFYFTGIYAMGIRIVISSYFGWPATKVEFFYFDSLRFHRIQSTQSLRNLKQIIDHNFVGRLNNQLEINQRYFFQPNQACTDSNSSACFTGIELCRPKTIRAIRISFKRGEGFVPKVHITYSLNGRSFNCWQDCRQISLNQSDQSTEINMEKLFAKNVRVHPLTIQSDAKMQVEYDYS